MRGPSRFVAPWNMKQKTLPGPCRLPRFLWFQWLLNSCDGESLQSYSQGMGITTQGGSTSTSCQYFMNLSLVSENDQSFCLRLLQFAQLLTLSRDSKCIQYTFCKHHFFGRCFSRHISISFPTSVGTGGGLHIAYGLRIQTLGGWSSSRSSWGVRNFLQKGLDLSQFGWS